MTTAGTGELRFIEGNMDDALPSETVFQPHRRDDNCLAAEGEGDGVAKYVSGPEHM